MYKGNRSSLERPQQADVCLPQQPFAVFPWPQKEAAPAPQHTPAHTVAGTRAELCPVGKQRCFVCSLTPQEHHWRLTERIFALLELELPELWSKLEEIQARCSKARHGLGSSTARLSRVSPHPDQTQLLPEGFCFCVPKMSPCNP